MKVDIDVIVVWLLLYGKFWNFLSSTDCSDCIGIGGGFRFGEEGILLLYWYNGVDFLLLSYSGAIFPVILNASIIDDGSIQIYNIVYSAIF